MNKFFCFFISFFFISSLLSYSVERDSFIEEILNSKNISEPTHNVEYNYTDSYENILNSRKILKPVPNLKYNYFDFERIPIKLQIAKDITTKKNSLLIGQQIDFIVKEDVIYNHKIIVPKGTKATAKIQAYQSRGLNGIPAMIILDDFEIPNIDKKKLKDDYIKRGQDRSYIVFPIKWALTWIPLAGYTTNVILGGHAHIKKKHNVIIYYYPKWAEN